MTGPADLESLAVKIASDLEKSGFGSEMRAIDAFAAKDWNCSGNFSYFDRDEEITREGDIQAGCQNFIQFENNKHIDSWYFIAAEVKKSEKPWVLFKKDISTEADWFRLGEGWRNMICSVGLPCNPPKIAATLSLHTIRQKEKWIAYGIHESFKDPKQPSRWYPALVSVCKAAEHVLESNSWESEETPEEKSIEHTSTYFVFVKPIIILDAPLFSAELDASNNIKVESIKFGTIEFEFRTKKYDRGFYIVDIVTLDSIQEYIVMSELRHKAIFEEILLQRSKATG